MSDFPRILLIAPSAYTLSGMATWLDYLLPGLAARGWQPVLGLVAGRFHDVGHYLAAHPWNDCVTISNPTGSSEGRIRALTDTIWKVRPQLVLSVNIPTTYAAIERMRVRGVETPPVAMTTHSVDASFLADARAWSHVLDGIIGTNALLRRLAQEYSGIECSRLFYAPCGVELPPGSIGPRRGGGALRIGYSGRLEKNEKRAHDLPGVLEHLDRLGVDYEFQVAGGGSYQATLLQRLQPGIERGRVRFLGVLSPAELNERLYRWADALLVTSFCETGPIVVWEAMALGLPVVSSRYIGSGLEGSLRDGENCLLFPIGDTEAAAARLARLTDAGLRATLADRAYRLVAERYTRERSVESWDACLRAILELPQRPASDRITPVPPAGRLDRWLGTGLGETMRRRLGQSFQHTGPGGEWPHASGGVAIDEEEFWERARQLDVPAATAMSGTERAGNDKT